MENNLKIRLATVADARILRDACESTFLDTYSTFNTPENLEKYILDNFELEKIISDIQTIDNQWIMLFFGEEIAGFSKLVKNNVPVKITEKSVIEIEKFYIKKQFHGKNLGRFLMNFCENWATQNNFDVIWLGVWENNQNAINFYQKMGFEKFSSHTFLLGNEAQNDFLMKKKI